MGSAPGKEDSVIAVVACMCGSSDSLVRNFLKSINYPGWVDIPIHKGKEKSLAILNALPPTPEKEMLKTFLRSASKWAVVIGYSPASSTMKWSDIAHNGAKSRIEAEFVVKTFSDLR